ncbi:conserved protein of unknown function [Tenacibaculum sp. 190130A14a]|uniref:Uncharacterized protein n=1 Tax=Tenacibaculum polynesiense TaxID=3137857 RepID=A0ABM9PA51_9FLAO
MKNPKISYERLFKITCKKSVVCLAGSMSVINGKVSEKNFENEVYKVTFSAIVKDIKIMKSIMFTANECICEIEIKKLKEQLGIVLEGDGMRFKIVSFKHNFTLQFDQLNSAFVNTSSVKNGVIFFDKDKLE